MAALRSVLTEQLFYYKKSQMSVYVPTKQHLREALLLFFNQKKSAAESFRLLQETYPEHAPTERTCQLWFKRFKSGVFLTEDKERPGRLRKFEDDKLKALLDQNASQTQKELAEALGVTQRGISHRLKAMGMVKQKVTRRNKNLKNDQGKE